METKSRRPATFGAWLESQLLRREWSRSDFARRLGTRPATVSRWILGVRTPDPESCEKIADVLFVDVDEVLAIAGHRPRLPQDELERWQSVLRPYLRRLDPANPEHVMALVAAAEQQIRVEELRAGTRTPEQFWEPVELEDEEEE